MLRANKNTLQCDELLQLAHAHDDWQAVHSPAPSGVNLKEVGELDKLKILFTLTGSAYPPTPKYDMVVFGTP